MTRPTIALCCILKNEKDNIDRFMASIKDCFDEVHLTDTGSTDGSIEHIKQNYPSVYLHHFEWVNDFGKAREFSMAHTQCAYLMWLDLDDVLVNREAFIKWRDEVMYTNHYWTATYNYTLAQDGTALCQFIRERAVRRDFGFKWSSYLHEGLVQSEQKAFWRQHAANWHVNHLRSDEDFSKDKGRNLAIFEQHLREGNMTDRMRYYYGKELFENGFHREGGRQLMQAVKSGKLELHDMIAAVQFAAVCALRCTELPDTNKAGLLEQAIDLCHQGLQLLPTRAELHCTIGDAYYAAGQYAAAIPSFEAARTCKPETLGGTLFITHEAYFNHPTEQLSRCYHMLGDFDASLMEVEKLKDIEPERYVTRYMEIMRAKEENKRHPGKRQVEDIVLVCPPFQIPEWDSDLYEEKGLGGSETAAVEVTNWVRKLTGRSVKVFNIRQTSLICKSEVEYYPLQFLTRYLMQSKPRVVINWRHATRLSDAPTYIWAHDLLTPSVDVADFDKMLVLSEFHRDYAYSVQGVPNDKTLLFRNGLNPEHIARAKIAEHWDNKKDPLKIIWPSSPDRGLDRIIEIVKRARNKSGLDFKLSVFYGFDNMRRMGMNAMADQLEGLMHDNRDFVTFHGMVDKHTLYEHWHTSSLWVYPANFIETFCISALEALACGVYPIVRDVGALKYTLKDALAAGMATMVDGIDVVTDADFDKWAEAVIAAHAAKAWERVQVDVHKYAWEGVARDLLKLVGIDARTDTKSSKV